MSSQNKNPWELTRDEFTAKMDTEWKQGNRWFNKEHQISNIRREIVIAARDAGEILPGFILEEYKDQLKN